MGNTVYPTETLNTLLGMGTVFVVLILISFIISAFNLVPKIQASFAPKKAEVAPVPEPEPAAPVVEEEDLSDDMELVAVIAAAIATYEGTSVEGFRVRSIRRAGRKPVGKSAASICGTSTGRRKRPSMAFLSAKRMHLAKGTGQRRRG